MRVAPTAVARLALLVSLLLISSSSVRAQDPASLGADIAPTVHTLQVREGRLHLDGEALPSEAVPADLDLRGVDLLMQFSGDVAPVLTFDGEAYVLDGRRLVRFEKAGETAPGVQAYGLGPAQRRTQAETPAPPVGGEEAYLMRLSERDRHLYDLIQQERAMEAEAQARAQRIRRTADPERRAALVRDLRAHLDAAFALKQDVRRAEIERAAQQVDAVRARLAERAARRDAIVEERLRSLVGDL